MVSAARRRRGPASSTIGAMCRFAAVVALAAAAATAACEPHRRPDRTVKCAGVGDQIKATRLDREPARAEAVALRLVQHCVNDGWSDDAITCARTAPDPRTCLGKLTIAQLEKLQQDPEIPR